MAEKATEKAIEPQADTRLNPIDQLYNNLSEGTLTKSPMVPVSYRAPYNPDDLWQKKGDYSLYESMVQDDQVSVCLRLKKDLVLGEGGHFVPGEEGQDEIVDDLECAFFEDYEGDFMGDLEEILTSYDFGFSITEKIFKIRDESKLGLKKLKTRHPNSWRLHTDDKGNLEKYEQITSEGDLDINPKSVIHYINDSRFQNPYGNSDLRSAYTAWFTKNQIVRFMGIFMEKSSSPIPVGRYDKNSPPNTGETLLNILKKFQTKTAITLPKEVEVEFLEAKNNGDVFVKAIHMFNMFIGRSLFIPDLLGFTGGETGGGSLALGEKQMNLFFLHILRRRAALEALINKELVWPTVLYNHGHIKKYPKFRLKPLDDMKAVELAKTWLDAVKGKTFQPNEEEINHFRKLVKFPEGPVEFAKAMQLPFGSNPELEGDDDENTDGDLDDPKNKQLDQENDSIDDSGAKGKKEVEEKDGDQKPPALKKDLETEGNEKAKKKEFKAYEAPAGNYSKKVNFKAIETKLNDYDQSIMSESKKIVKKMFQDLFDQIERKRIIQNQNTERIDTLSLKYKKELKQALKASFMELFKDAQSQANSELMKSEFRKPLTSDKFLQVIEDETFKFVGDYEYGILKKVRTELISAIKDGKALSAVMDILDRDLEQMSEVQIERFARTKHTEVMNNARVEYFESTGVVAAYQYSAILDNQTSDICAGLHGKIFVAGTEPIPPMHFNCRSTLVPITKYEEFKPTESIRGQSVNEFIEENKGDGFSTK